MVSVVEQLKLRSVLRPTNLFPKQQWHSLEAYFKASGFTKNDLHKLYLKVCRFKEYYRGGVVLEEFFKYCHLEVIGLDHLASELFPTYEYVIIHKKILNQVSKELEKLVVIPLRGPQEPFTVDKGFTESIKKRSINELHPGTKVIIKHHGTYDEARVDPAFVSCATDENKILVMQDQQYDHALQKNNPVDVDEDDTVAEALQHTINNMYAINFVKFSRQLVRVLTMDYFSLLTYLFSELCQEDLYCCIELLHRNGSKRDRRILTQLVDSRFKLDARGRSRVDRLVYFSFVYPAIVYPLISLRRHILRRLGLTKVPDMKRNKKNLNTQKAEMGTSKHGKMNLGTKDEVLRLCVQANPLEPPESFRLAWAYTGQNVMKNVLATLQMSNNNDEGSNSLQGYQMGSTFKYKKGRFQALKRNARKTLVQADVAKINELSKNASHKRGDIAGNEGGLNQGSRLGERKRSSMGRRSSIGKKSSMGRRSSLGRRNSIGKKNSRRSSLGRRSSFIKQETDNGDMRHSRRNFSTRRSSFSQANAILSAYDLNVKKEKKIKKRQTIGEVTKFGLNLQGECFGCKQTKTLKPCRACPSCLSICQQKVADQSGCQHASMIVAKANLATETYDNKYISKVKVHWIEQQDPVSKKYFFYSVLDGKSSWELPKRVKESRVNRINSNEKYLEDTVESDSSSSSDFESNYSDESDLFDDLVDI